MKLELDYFYIGNAYGGEQAWFSDYWMRLGGCAAVTACDCSIYFSLFRQKNLYPYDVNHVMREDYIRFSKKMKPYLRPRMSGIDRLDIYIDGFRKYLTDRNEAKLKMKEWEGGNQITDTKIVVKQQINEGFPIPCLILKHVNPDFQDYVWHWLLLTGYEEVGKSFMVKVVTYGSWRWLKLDELWDTGYERKGGLILFYE
jgi:hypothetical protein